MPWVVGDFDWMEFHRDSDQCEKQRLCQVCAEPLAAVIVLCRGHLQGMTSGPGCHPRCAALAVQFCPHLIELDSDGAEIPVAYRYEGDGLGYDPMDEDQFSEEMAIDESAAPLTRAEVRALAAADPLGTKERAA